MTRLLTDAEWREHRECVGWMVMHLERMLEAPHPDRDLVKFALSEARRQFQRPGNGELLESLYNRLTRHEES